MLCRVPACEDRNSCQNQQAWNFVAVLAVAVVPLSAWDAASALFAVAILSGGPVSVVYATFRTTTENHYARAEGVLFGCGFIIKSTDPLCIAGSMANMALMSVPSTA